MLSLQVKASPLDSLVLYPGHSLRGMSYPSVEIQLVYSTAPVDWAKEFKFKAIIANYKLDTLVCRYAYKKTNSRWNFYKIFYMRLSILNINFWLILLFLSQFSRLNIFQQVMWNRNKEAAFIKTSICISYTSVIFFRQLIHQQKLMAKKEINLQLYHHYCQFQIFTSF